MGNRWHQPPSGTGEVVIAWVFLALLAAFGCLIYVVVSLVR